jgi:hypothetical protein
MARVIDAIELHRKKKLSCVEAGALLGMSERHFRRLRDAYEERGAEGIIDRRRGRASGRRAGVDEVAWVIEAFRTRYFDFTAKHFHEAVHGRLMADGKRVVRSYTSTKSVLQQHGLITRAPKRSAHRKKRARRPLPGMLVFQDGSNHAWLPQGPPRDLIVTMDDATSAILSAVLVEEEGTASSFIGLKETLAAQGLFCALYADRGSHYFYTPKAGEPVDKTRLTQVGRALKQLGIEHIPSYCPEGRGRMERLFGTLQSRLPPLMRQEGLASIEAANRWLATVYIPQHNARFAVAAAGRARPSCRSWARSTTSCASRMSAWWGTTTRSATRVACCRSPSSATGATSSRRTCAFTNTPMAGLRSSTVRAGLPITRRTEP